MATYKVSRIVKGDTKIDKFPATASETYYDGEIVYWSSGAVTEVGNTTGSAFGIARVDSRDGVTASSGDLISVEYPVERNVVFELYADAAVTAGTAYDIGTSGQVDPDSTSNTIFRAMETTSAAGTAKVKFLDSILE